MAKVQPKLVVLVTGDRYWTMDNADQCRVIQSSMRALRRQGPIRIIHGDARGVDSIADYYARKCGFEVRPHPARWNEYHRAAGPIRNREMLEEKPTLVLAFHDDLAHSKGTKDMVRQSLRHGIKVMHIQSDGTSTVVEEI